MSSEPETAQTKPPQLKKHKNLNAVFTIILLVSLVVSILFINLQRTELQSKNAEISDLKEKITDLSIQKGILEQQLNSLEQQLSDLKKETSANVNLYQDQISGLQNTIDQYITNIKIICLANNGTSGVFLTDISVGPSYSVGLSSKRNANVTINNLLGDCNVILTFCGADYTYSIPDGTSQRVGIIRDYGIWVDNSPLSLVIKEVKR